MNIHFLLNLSNYKDIRSARQKVRTNFKWQTSKGDVNIGTLIVLQTFEKASVKMNIWCLKIERQNSKHLEIQLTRTVE